MTHSTKTSSSIPVIRAVRDSDFDQIHDLAQLTGGGMTNLPMERKTLRARIDFALECFAADVKKPGGEVYILVLERDGEVIGTAGLFSAIGLTSGFVNYRINTMFHFSEQLGKRISRRVLIATHDFTGSAEVGSLFLSPKARGGGFGKLLARSRYLFVAQARHLFADHMCAELRGWRAPDGSQPFWDALGERFFDMDFEDADQHNSKTGNQFIADLMPIYPIYIAILPKAARECIGKPHENAKPAYDMLLREGFEYSGYVDIFDAGPLVEARVKDIRTVRDSREYAVKIEPQLQDGPQYLLAYGQGRDFRAIRAPVILGDGEIVITPDSAEALNVTQKDKVRAISW